MNGAQATAGDGSHRATTPTAGSGTDSSAGKSASSSSGGAGGSDSTSTGMTASSGSGGSTDSSSTSGDTAGTSASSNAADAGSAGTMSQQAPVDVVPACMGHAGSNVCDNATLYHCGDMGSATSKDPCTSATRCQAGVSSGKCGVCDPNDYQCTDKTPSSCNAMGQWEMQKPCDTAALCTAGMKMHSCDPSKCNMGAFDCSMGLLRKCKDDQTDWDQGTMCDMDLCDMTAGKCNECKPGSMAMCSDPMTIASCSMDGKKMSQACSGATASCLNGACAQCAMDTDCKAPNDCQAAMCDSTGTCKNTGKPSHSPCKLGGNTNAVCDYLGNCVACLDDSDCHSGKLECNPAIGCLPRPALEVTPGLPGTYIVKIAPGYKLDAGVGLTTFGATEAPDAATMPSIATVSGGTGGPCQLPFPNSGTMVTIWLADTGSNAVPQSDGTITPANCMFYILRASPI